jgi:hypothetical protein
MDDDGDFIVVWLTSSYDVLAGQRFDAAGMPQGGEFSVVSSSYNVFGVATAMDSAGNFVVVWQTLGQDGSNQGVFARRYDAMGGELGGEFQINTRTTGQQNFPEVATDADGDFVVVWQSYLQDDESAYQPGVFGQRFASSGAPLGGEFLVNSYTSGPQTFPKVAMDADGDFVVVWESGHDGAPNGIFGQRFTSAGARQGAEFLVNAFTSSNQSSPAVAMDDAGRFVVAFRSPGDGAVFGIFARRFDTAGTALGTEFRVSTYTTSGTPQAYPAVAADGDGDFVVVWFTPGQDDGGGQGGVFGQRFDSSGAPQGVEFQVNSYTEAQQDRQAVAMNADGDFVVVWKDLGQYAILGRRFFGAVLDVDGNGTVEALTDGLLVLRYRFGFTGATLIAGVVDTADCTRCAAADILAYLTSIENQLDVDGDGETEALTDGLLILRFLFSFTGATLISGAFDSVECVRCTAEEIAAYISGLVG